MAAIVKEAVVMTVEDEVPPHHPFSRRRVGGFGVCEARDASGAATASKVRRIWGSDMKTERQLSRFDVRSLCKKQANGWSRRRSLLAETWARAMRGTATKVVPRRYSEWRRWY